MQHIWRGTVGILSLMLVACDEGVPQMASAAARGTNVPSLSDTAMLQEIGFTKPVMITVAMDTLFDRQGHLFDNENNRRLGFLLTTGHVVLNPLPAAPWLNYQAHNAGIKDNQVQAIYGWRVIAGRSNEQRWTEGPIQFFAETISYAVQPDAFVADKMKIPAQPFTLRLVAQFDPAIGAWKVVMGAPRGTNFTGADTNMIMDILGKTDLAVAASKIEAVRKIAYDAGEAAFAASGTLARDEAEGIRTSKRAGLMYFLFPGPFSGVSQAAAEERCASFMPPRHPLDWHLPTLAEFRTIVDGNVIIDLPDGRFWAGAAAATNGGWRDIILEPDTPNAQSVPVWEVNANGAGGPNSYNIQGRRDAVIHDVFRIMCVSRI